ncbi:MAG: portal protein [Patescibacteria group bacterium]|nr:portal protein [Patescibacteria group bacterium]
MWNPFSTITNLFGFRIKRKESEEDQKQELSFVPKIDVSEGKQFVSLSFVNTSFNYSYDDFTQEDVIKKYREMAMSPEIEAAIDEIVNEVFYIGDNDYPVNIVLDRLNYSDTIKKKIEEEFKEILKILNFNENSYEYFRRWYVDGSIYFNVVIDIDNPTEGIKDLRYIDPIKIKKVIEIKSEKRIGGGILPIPDEYEEYFVYDNKLKIPVDSIIYSTSGLVKTSENGLNTINLSYLHKAIKPFNQLNMLEDAAVIYRIARAPERRIFKIPVPNGPKAKQEQYINELIKRYRNKISYDPNTGELKDSTRVLSILEDFWIPVPEGSTGADVTTLPGGQSLNDTGIENYFRNKLYRALYVPISRMSDEGSQSTYALRATEIIREEVKFAKFIQRLRNRFAKLFTQALKIQLILKNIIDLDEWENNIQNNIFYDFKRDSHYFEYNEAEIISRRIELAASAMQLEGYFSKRYIQKNFLKLTDEEIEEIENDLMRKPKKEGEGVSTGFGGFGTSPFEHERPSYLTPPQEELEEPGFSLSEPESEEKTTTSPEEEGGGGEEQPPVENI